MNNPHFLHGRPILCNMRKLLSFFIDLQDIQDDTWRCRSEQESRTAHGVKSYGIPEPVRILTIISDYLYVGGIVWFITTYLLSSAENLQGSAELIMDVFTHR